MVFEVRNYVLKQNSQLMSPEDNSDMFSEANFKIEWLIDDRNL